MKESRAEQWMTVADPDIWADPNIRLGEQFNMSPIISRLFLLWRGRKSIAKLDGGYGRICAPLDPPLVGDEEQADKLRIDQRRMFR